MIVWWRFEEKNPNPPECAAFLSSSEFSNNQWSKGVGTSRCRECVSEGITCDSDSFGAARTNNATRVDVNVFDYDEEGSACQYKDIQVWSVTAGRPEDIRSRNLTRKRSS